jgi:DNA end-binding protein Ku
MRLGIAGLEVGSQMTRTREDLMARAIWSGSVAFGLVNVPVGLFAATEDHAVHFNQFQEGTSDRIRYKRVNERTGREVDLAHIVRGHEVGDGDYVLLSDEELEAVEPGRSRTVDITDFVDLAEIDPIYYQKSYYLGPRGEGAARAYALLHRAMADTGKAGIATFVMHGKQYLATIRAAEPDVLVLETTFFADEVRDAADVVEDLPAGETFRGRELTIAKQLIESMTTGWDPANYHDTYRERVDDLIKRKQRGEEIVTEGGGAPEDSNVTDLVDALRRSAEEMRGRGKDARGGASGAKGRPKGRAATAGRARTAKTSSKATSKSKATKRTTRKAG